MHYVIARSFYCSNFLQPDINECPSALCHSNSICTNTPGSFKCICTGGLTGDGFRCGGMCIPVISNIDSAQSNVPPPPAVYLHSTVAMRSVTSKNI